MNKNKKPKKVNGFSRWLERMVIQFLKRREISPKLAKELLQRCDKIEKLSDRKAKEGYTAKWDCDSDWMTISCLISEMKQHILWHTR